MMSPLMMVTGGVRETHESVSRGVRQPSPFNWVFRQRIVYDVHNIQNVAVNYAALCCIVCTDTECMAS